MKVLKELHEKDIGIEPTQNIVSDYKLREAMRAVVFDENDKIAILNVVEDKYHKLPGGGVEPGEEHMQALKREINEEVGCSIEIVGEVGVIIEYKEQEKKQQTSYCYLAKIVGEKREPAFTDKEKEYGFRLEWMTINEAIEVLGKDEPSFYTGKFIKARDLLFLNKAKELI